MNSLFFTNFLGVSAIFSGLVITDLRHYNIGQVTGMALAEADKLISRYGRNS